MSGDVVRRTGVKLDRRAATLPERLVQAAVGAYRPEYKSPIVPEHCHQQSAFGMVDKVVPDTFNDRGAAVAERTGARTVGAVCLEMGIAADIATHDHYSS